MRISSSAVRQMWIGALQVGRDHGRHGRQHAGVEALHVAGAAAVEAVALRRQGEGVGGPGLALHRHHVEVAGEDDAAVDARADGRPDVGVAPVRLRHDLIGDAVRRQILADEGDEIEVAGVGDGGESDEALEQFDAGQGHATQGADGSHARQGEGPAWLTG
jgi:hypothetical protein